MSIATIIAILLNLSLITSAGDYNSLDQSGRDTLHQQADIVIIDTNAV